jgi:hypothetical protein
VIYLPVHTIPMKKIFAMLSAIIAGGSGIALVSSVPESAQAALTAN